MEKTSLFELFKITFFLLWRDKKYERTPNMEKRIYRFFLATKIAREYDITVARRALVPRESPGTHKNTRIITYSLVAAFLFTF